MQLPRTTSNPKGQISGAAVEGKIKVAARDKQQSEKVIRLLWEWWQQISPGGRFCHNPTTLPSFSTLHLTFPPIFCYPHICVVFFVPSGEEVSQIWCSWRGLNGGMIMIIITEMMMKDVLLWVIQWCHWETMRSWGGERQLCASRPVRQWDEDGSWDGGSLTRQSKNNYRGVY